MKKFLALFLVLLLSLSLLVSCKPHESGDDDLLPPSSGDGSSDDDKLQPGSDPSGSDLNWDVEF